MRPTSLRSAIRYFSKKVNAGRETIYVKREWLTFSTKYINMPSSISLQAPDGGGPVIINLPQAQDVVQRLGSLSLS